MPPRHATQHTRYRVAASILAASLAHLQCADRATPAVVDASVGAARSLAIALAAQTRAVEAERDMLAET